jgi:hypothetical protein
MTHPREVDNVLTSMLGAELFADAIRELGAARAELVDSGRRGEHLSIFCDDMTTLSAVQVGVNSFGQAWDARALRGRVSRALEGEGSDRELRDVLESVLETLEADARDWESVVDRFSAEAVREGRRLPGPEQVKRIRAELPDTRRIAVEGPVHQLVVWKPLPGSGMD